MPMMMIIVHVGTIYMCRNRIELRHVGYAEGGDDIEIDVVLGSVEGGCDWVVQKVGRGCGRG